MASLHTTRRWLLLSAAGLASFLLALQLGRRETDASEQVVEAVTRDTRPAVRDSVPAPSAPAHGLPDTLAARSRLVPSSSGNAFAVLNWQPPPAPVRVAPTAPPPPPPQPVAPVAPPLPFSFVGLMEKGTARPQAFLAKGDALLVVGVGDLIDNNTYRVDALTAQQIVLTYLPLNTTQTLHTTGGTK